MIYTYSGLFLAEAGTIYILVGSFNEFNNVINVQNLLKELVDTSLTSTG